jgi:hypothetical protein
MIQEVGPGPLPTTLVTRKTVAGAWCRLRIGKAVMPTFRKPSSKVKQAVRSGSGVRSHRRWVTSRMCKMQYSFVSFHPH